MTRRDAHSEKGNELSIMTHIYADREGNSTWSRYHIRRYKSDKSFFD